MTGRIERGKVKVGEEVEIVGFRDTRKTVVTGVEMFKKQLDEGLAGDNAGLLLRGIAKEDVERGMVLAKGGSITPHTKFKAEVYILTKEEGGRHTPFFKGYRPQFYLRTTDVTGVAELPAATEMVMPGDNMPMVTELITPVAIEKGLRFAIREGGPPSARARSARLFSSSHRKRARRASMLARRAWILRRRKACRPMTVVGFQSLGLS